MNERDLVETFLRDHVLAARALVALLLNQLPDVVRSREHELIQRGGGSTELRTRVETGAIELLLVSDDVTEPLWLVRSPAS